MLVPEELDGRIRKAAQRARVSKGAWVRRAIEEALTRSGADRQTRDPLAGIAALGGPTADIEQMLGEIEAGRR